MPGHRNIMKYCNRPFSTVEEMDRIIIENFFNVVQRGDIVYYLGDFSFNKDLAESFFMKLKEIQFHFIRGNHDKAIQNSMIAKYCSSYTDGYKDIHIKNGDIRITLCHYPMYVWKHSHYGAWMLYGHSHSNIISEKFNGKMMNVGVDVNNFYPVSLEEVKVFMEKREDNWDLVNVDKKQSM